MKTALTRENAEKVLEQVKAKYAVHIEAGYAPPTLVQDWDWIGGLPTPWAILWEEGPYDWAILFGGGGIDDEIYSLAIGELGADKARELATVEPTEDLPGIFTEPVTSWALGIYEA